MIYVPLLAVAVMKHEEEGVFGLDSNCFILYCLDFIFVLIIYRLDLLRYQLDDFKDINVTILFFF